MFDFSLKPEKYFLWILGQQEGYFKSQLFVLGLN
jgi:hypothetical protein